MLLAGEPSAPVAEVITPEIQALADGLGHSPERIFDYVHDRIRFVLYFGSKKGAALTLLERSGNDFDQSALLVALLRAAGQSDVGYQFGWMWVPYDDPNGHDYDLRHWWRLTLTNTNWNYTSNYLTGLVLDRGYPAAFPADGYLLLQRTWVVLTNSGTVYNLDPAFKVSEPLTGIGLTSALGGTSASISNGLWSAAGGTSMANYVSGLSEGSLRGTLTQYTTNVLNYLQNNSPNASVQEILGGWQITPATASDYRTTTLFSTADWNGSMPILTWANEPTNMMSTLTITFAGTNCQRFLPQLQGQRLALTYDGNGLAQLWQDDTLMAQRSTTSADTNVVLAIAHPVGGWNTTNNSFIPNPTNGANQVVTNAYKRTSATYALIYAFEPDWGWLKQRQNRLDAYRDQGLTNGSRQVLSETLNVMGLGWMLQTEGVEEMLAGQLNMLPMYYHRLGRMAQESGKGYYVDVYMQLSDEYPSGGNDAAHTQLANNHFDLVSFFGSALEHGIIEQLQNTNLVGASTVKMLQIASTNGQSIYLANSANWSSIQGGLSNYGSSVLNQINTRFIIPGFNVLMPANGSNRVAGAGSWAGYGYAARLAVGGQAVDSRMIIAGGYYGGYASDPAAVVNSPYVGLVAQAQSDYYSLTPVQTPAPTGADPVDLGNGTFQLENTVLALGQAEPRGLSLTCYYNGTRRYSSVGGMTGGWLHNYCVSAASVPAPQAGLGGTTPAQAAPMMAAAAAAIALYSGNAASPKNWTVTALIAKWGVDQLTRNGVSVALGKDTLQFVQQPNGVYTPPANCTWALTRASGAYSLQQRHGSTFNFDSLGRLATITDPYNQSLNVTYLSSTSSLPQTVTDWKNRTLTFNYTGTPSRLFYVSDNSTPQRTVAFAYTTYWSPRGDLGEIIDPDQKWTDYYYQTNHLITATLDGLSRLVVSNIYDTQGRVTTQYTQGDTNKVWRIFWSDWLTTTIDPAGGQRDYMYDNHSRLIASWDELGDEFASWYDGQNHVYWTLTTLGEWTQFFYDGNHNLLQKIDPLGFTNQFFYDSQFNLTRAIDPRGKVSTFGYNAQFSLTGSTNGAGDWVTYSYNADDGTLNTRTDPGGTTSYTYDGTYRQLNKITYPGSLGAEGFSTALTGDVLSQTNGRGYVTSFQYNKRRELTTTTGPTNLTINVTYDDCGNPRSRTDARGFTTTSFWNPTRHQTGTVFPATPQGTPATTNLYDSRDWLVRSINNPQSAISSTVSYTNDATGRRASVTDPLGRTTRFGYDPDGRQTASTNAAQEVVLQQWDLRGQLTNWVDPASHAVRRGYDPAGNQIALTNRNSKRWQFQFDAANRLTNTITPLNRQTWQLWNNRGLLAAVRDPMSQWTTNLYDARARLTNVTDAAGVRLYSFDANNNLTSVTNVGKASRLSWGYDAYDRPSAFTNADGYVVQYRYDANGNVSNLIYPGSRTVTYLYDSLNRLTNVTDWSGRQTGLGYDLASRLTTITRPNNTVRVLSYDAAGETTNIVEMTASAYPIAFFALGWGNSGRVAWEFGAPLPPVTNAPPSRTMTVDDDNRLATFNGQNVVHDLDGNMTTGPLTNNTLVTYGYNARNQLISAGGLAYAYDPAGNRLAVTNGANVTRYVINPNAKLPQALMRVRSGVTNYYIYGQGLLYEITETATSTNTLTYHFDYRGSTVALADKNGNLTDRMQYSAYGLTAYRAGTNDTPFLYNGRYGVMTDPNGLLHMRARYYNPYICRFINPDPAGFAGGLNWYCYADGNPISLLDPFGLCAVGETGGFSWLPTVNGAAAVLIPGAGSAQNAYSYFSQGNYANGAASAVSSVGESVVGGLMYANSAASVSLGRVGNWISSLWSGGSSAAEGIANPVSSTLARVVDARFVNSPTLGAPGAADVFVTAANDIRGITTSQGLANRLTLLDNAGNLRQGPFAVIQFDTPASGLASPVFRNNPGFIQGGLSGGGAREFVLPNMPVNQLQNVTTRIIP
jgi:RHS repeat-associated protein